MNARLEVIRFRNEDVIVTSGIEGIYCDHVGLKHLLITGESVPGTNVLNYDYPADYIRYNAPGDLHKITEVTIRSNNSLIPVGTFYYFDSNGSLLKCEIQNHGQ